MSLTKVRQSTLDTTDLEWIYSGLTPTYISATSFSVPGDQTAILTVGRRVKTTNGGGTIYSSILTSVFGAGITTLVVANDSGNLDAGISAVYYGLLNSGNSSIPAGIARSGANTDITSLAGLTGAVSGPASISLQAAGGPIANASNINGASWNGFLNKLYNGACEISQENGTTLGTTTQYYPVDGMYVYMSVAKLSAQQVTDAPAGFKNSAEFKVVTQYAPAAADEFGIGILLEGSDVIDLQYGAAGAITTVFSGYIKSSVAGNYAVSIRNSAQDRSYVGTIAVTNGWTRLAITIPGDQTGTWLTDINTGIRISIDLGSGANYNTPSANAWAAGKYSRTAGSVTFVNQVAGTKLNITGVQFEQGNIASPFFKLPASIELARCQRFWQFGFHHSSMVPGTSSFDTTDRLPVHMRAAPTVVYNDGAGNYGAVRTTVGYNYAPIAGGMSTTGDSLIVNMITAAVAPYWGEFNYTLNARLT